MPTYSVAIKTQARINWNILITLNFAHWPESISAATGSVETQEPHQPSHMDLHTQTYKGPSGLATGSGPAPSRWGAPSTSAEGRPGVCRLSFTSPFYPKYQRWWQPKRIGTSWRPAFIDILVLFIFSRKFASSITLAGSPSSQEIKHLQIGVFFFTVQFNSVAQSCQTLCDPMNHSTPGLPCPSPTPGVHPNPCALSRWCHPTISSSVVPFSSCPQSFQASGSFQMSQLFTQDGQSTEVSASTSVLPMKTQDFFFRMDRLDLLTVQGTPKSLL